MLDSNQVKEMLTTEDIIRLCCDLQGEDNYFYDSQNHPMFLTSLEHEGGDSFKLCYYPETKLFYCFTRGTSDDIFSLVQKAKGFEDFMDAFKFVCQYFNLKDNGFNEEKPDLTDDWDIFQQIEDYSNKEEEKPNDIIQSNILEYYYPLAAPVEWQQDGISPEVMRAYGIRVDTALQKIIIPHRDINGNLIGIRCRNFNPIEIEKGKYMPVKIEETWYSHSLGKNLYGLAENRDTIKKLKKVVVCESEKSVLQAASFYGINNNWVVATCGSNLSEYQMDLLLNLGVEEVVLGYDHDFTTGRGEPETIEYEKKLIHNVQYLTQYVNVYIIMDYDGITGYKDSPTDRGKEIFEKLLHNKIHVGTLSVDILKKRR